MPFRSILFVPGSRPDRFAKAAEAGADAVCVDLEDAVAPDSKTAARSAVIEAMGAARARPGAFGVRVNSPRTAWGLADLAALADGERPDFVMLPKVDHAEEIVIVRDALGAQSPLWAVIETAIGLERAYAIAAAPGVDGVVHGGGDLSADLGVALTDWDALAYARARIAAAAAAAGVEAVDVPHIDVKDEAGLTETSARVRRLGYTGRLCIHPVQVDPVNAAFSPSAAEVDQARRVVAALAEAAGGAALLDGKLIEAPIERTARRILAAAGEEA